MSRKSFKQGLNLYQGGNYQKALQHFTDALTYDGPNKYLILDSRSSTYLKLGEIKEALKDAKMTIELAPDRWQGYARAARVFFQAKKLRASLAMVEMALARLKEEETHRRDSLQSLLSEVEAAQWELETHRKLSMDHMGKLPVEIFSEIAQMVAEDNPNSPIVLSHVSKHWRDVTQSIPRLWDTLVLTKRRPSQKAKLWLEQSKGMIKELSVRASVMDVPRWVGDSLDHLQWDRLKILKVYQWDIASFLLQIGKMHTLINIEHLEIDHPDQLRSFPFSNYDPGQEDCSKLRHLIITADQSHYQMISQFPIRNLYTLTLCNVALLQDLLDILESSPRIEHLSLQNVSCHHPPGELILPTLKTLSLKQMAPSIIFTAKLPSLEVLRIDSTPAYPAARDFFRLLVDNNSSHLTELVIRSTAFPHESLVDLLRISKNLQTLEICNVSSLARSIIEALAETYIPPSKDPAPNLSNLAPIAPICPLLKSVNFSACPDVETGPLVRLIKSRLSSYIKHIYQGEETLPDHSEITSLSVDYCPRVDPDWLPWLREKVPLVSCIYTKKNAKFRAS